MSNEPLLDPTAELSPAEKQLQPRLRSLAGATVGLLDISKPRGREFLDVIADFLQQQGAIVNRYMKPTFARTAPLELNRKISAECDAVIEGLAD